MINEKCPRGDGMEARQGGAAQTIFGRKNAQADAFVVDLEVRS